MARRSPPTRCARIRTSTTRPTCWPTRSMSTESGSLLTNGGSEAIALVARELGGSVVAEPEFSLHPRGAAPAAVAQQSAQPDRAARRHERLRPTCGTKRSIRWRPARGREATTMRSSCGSLTKLFACPGLRLGYVIADDAARFRRSAAGVAGQRSRARVVARAARAGGPRGLVRRHPCTPQRARELLARRAATGLCRRMRPGCSSKRRACEIVWRHAVSSCATAPASACPTMFASRCRTTTDWLDCMMSCRTRRRQQ